MAQRIARYREAQPEGYVKRTKKRASDGEFQLPCEFTAASMAASGGGTSARLEQPGADNDPLTNAKKFALTAETARLLIAAEFTPRQCAFELSGEERELVDIESNLLLLGRSGTGKTNVLMERVLRRHCNGLKLAVDVSQLVITASPRLCTALEALFKSRSGSSEPGEAANARDKQQLAAASTTENSTTFVTYVELVRRLWRNQFALELKLASPFTVFWGGLDERMTRHFPEQLVCGEVASRIQGSRSALGSARGSVSREDYIRCTQASRRADALTEKECNVIYDIFEAYDKWKRFEGTRDLNDAAHELFNAFSKESTTSVLPAIAIRLRI